MANGRVLHARQDGYHVLRYYGRVDYMLAPSIQRFTDDLLSHEKVNALIFDLTEAEYLDSTNLGLLARVAERVRSSPDAHSVIVCSDGDIGCVLRSMAFDQIFDIVAATPSETPQAQGEEIPAQTPSQHDLRNTMLDAHKRLVELSDEGRIQFQDVVRALESEPT